jgi:hypothetical protein
MASIPVRRRYAMRTGRGTFRNPMHKPDRTDGRPINWIANCDNLHARLASRLGAPRSAFAPNGVMASSPITGELIAQVRLTSPEEVSTVIGRATQALTLGARSPHRGVGNSCGFSRRNCAPPRMSSAAS